MSQLDNSVHISNLPYQVSREEVLTFLQSQENSDGVKIINMPNHHKFPQNNRGFCDVELPTAEQAQSFMESVNDVEFSERKLRAEKMKKIERPAVTNNNTGYASTRKKRPRNQFFARVSNIDYNTRKRDWIQYIRNGKERTQGFFIEAFPMESAKRNKGYFFVSFPTEEMRDKFITDLDDREVFRRFIHVIKAPPKPQRSRGGQTDTQDNSSNSNEIRNESADEPEAPNEE